ncbi:Protein of unknown function [Sulfitobacter brevis]|uniref:Gene transfer agent protein n=1 Tax=Sulfitobacter brevis TaxID=74348 RepID=A0A1I1ZLG3_9RHOB|nr:DUF3168 domain-containing protein [Sulfitobacter brevis]SFE32557.1 Protein of unknown function [Sulfitobacter brevis]
MSFALSGPLQATVFNHLSADAPLAALVGDAIYDAMPAGTVPDTYVQLGGETVRDASDGSGDGAVHLFTVSVFTTVAGFAGAKAVAGAVSDALQNADLALSRGKLVSLRFDRASAKRIESASLRKIELRFRARVQDD